MENYTTELIFNQEELNLFCKIMKMGDTAHSDVTQALSLGYKQTIVPVIFAMSTSLAILNDSIFPEYEPLELYREYTCVRPMFVGEVYSMNYKLKEIDLNENIGIVCIRLKNKKGQVCVTGLVKLKLIDLHTKKV